MNTSLRSPASLVVLSIIVVVALIGCDKPEQIAPTQSPTDRTYEPFYPDSFRSHPIPEELNTLATWSQKVEWMRARSDSELFQYGLSRSPYGNVLSDRANMPLTDDQRLVVLAYFAFHAGVRGVEAPPMEALMLAAPVDSIDEIITPGSPEDLTPPEMRRVGWHRLIFRQTVQGWGPDYGFEMLESEHLDTGPVYGTDYWYLHRANGASGGALLSWTTAATSYVRTLGVAVSSYTAPYKVEFLSGFKYSAEDDGASAKINYPYEYTFNHNNCPAGFDAGETCVARAVMHPTHGTVFRPGCYSDNQNCEQDHPTIAQCGINNGVADDVWPTAATCGGSSTASTRGCPNVHYYYDDSGTIAYTGYNDSRWRVDAAISDLSVTSSVVGTSVSAADYSKCLGRTVTVVSVPFYRAWAKHSAGSTSLAPIWLQMFDGWISSDTNWSQTAYSETVWRGTANVQRDAGDAWKCGFGCASYCEMLPIWAPWPTSQSCNNSGNYAYPWKQKMSWVTNPWTQAGHLYGKFKTFGYCAVNCPNGICEDLDDSGHTSHYDFVFGDIDLTDNSYTTILKVIYEEKVGS